MNIRLKSKQRYCGSRACQQARRNLWEREKLRKDSNYKFKRQADKKKWYSNYPGDKYQSSYRTTHIEYSKTNHEKQSIRNQRRKEMLSLGKIVKTDALTSESITRQGLYVLLPYKKTDQKKIVKTDALIVQMLSGCGLEGFFKENSS